MVQEQPQPTLPIAQGVFPVINARYPTVVSDVRRARVGTYVVQTADQFEGDRFEDAREIFEECALTDEYPEFLTIPAYATGNAAQSVICEPGEAGCADAGVSLGLIQLHGGPLTGALAKRPEDVERVMAGRAASTPPRAAS